MISEIRIAELLAPFLDQTSARALCTRDLIYISTYIDILLRWNTRISLTAIRDPVEIITRHFGESLFAARVLFPEKSHCAPRMGDADLRVDGPASLAPRRITVADLGSGAGFPGIPIKLWVPLVDLTLVESNQKKVAFLREVVRALTLTNVNVYPGRAERLAVSISNPQDPAHGFEIVTLRAVEHFAKVLPTALSLAVVQARLALMIGRSQLGEALAITSVRWNSPLEIPLSNSRLLLIGTKL
ncbi:MAG TPA: 16S rRNA (guanine(527)-N(7))-methyltransferase RsmG [Candidatus Sulfotelmatobacter sp.]